MAQQEAQRTLLDKEVTWDEKFAKCDWSSKDDIIGLFPDYVQEQQKNARVKKVSNNVNIEFFSMKTPFGDRFLLKDTKLILEAKKRQCLFGENCKSNQRNQQSTIDDRRVECRLPWCGCCHLAVARPLIDASLVDSRSSGVELRSTM